jgi:O-acetyl-ADP-ribose deacetylase (regulator of RNase III)
LNVNSKKVDVIVCSVGTHLDLQRGACAKAIAAAAGDQLQDALYSTASPSDAAPGDVYVTQAYNLPCKFVLHTICHIYDQPRAEQVREALRHFFF